MLMAFYRSYPVLPNCRRRIHQNQRCCSVRHLGATKAGDRHLDSPVFSFVSIFFRLFPFFLIVFAKVVMMVMVVGFPRSKEE